MSQQATLVQPSCPAQRPCLLLAPLLALAMAACGGGSAPAPGGTTAALAASQPGELLAYVKTLLHARDAQRQANPAAQLDTLVAPGLALTAAGAPVAHSNTTVQEAGVDEEDLVKTDGTSVYSLDTAFANATGKSQNRLLVHRRSANGDIVPVQTLPLPVDPSAYPSPRGLMLAAAAQRLVVLSESVVPLVDPLPCATELLCAVPGALIYPPIALQSTVQLQLAELNAAGDATLGSRVAIDGRLAASRLVGNVLVLVTTHTPRLAFDLLPADATAVQKDSELAKLAASDVLPAWRASGAAAQTLLPETDCYVQTKNASLAIEVTTITAVDLASAGLTRASRCFVGGTEAVYMTPKSLYLATTRFPIFALASARIAYAPQFETDLHKFSVDGLAINYRASGSVKGHLGWDPQRKPLRLSEHNGDLRVLTFTGELGWALLEDANSPNAPPPSPATLTVLRESAGDQTLAAVATLPNSKHPEPLGKPGEQVHGVRFAGERGYLVTFRRVDPLFVLNLRNPDDPQLAGAIEVPGFSDYLFPLTDSVRDVDASGRLAGIKLGLFDVSDASNPKSLDSRTLGAAGSQSGLDYSSHGINWLQRAAVARIGLPMTLTATPYAANPQHGLQRIEVDTQARTMALKAMLPAPPGPNPYPDLWGDRSLQIESKLIYFSQGQVVVSAW
jgi:Beta propeller domain